MALAFYHGHGSPCAWLALERPDAKGLAPIHDELYRKPEGVAPDEARLEALPYFGKTFPPHWRP